MKSNTIAVVLCILNLYAVGINCTSNSYKILGGYIEVYNERETSYVRKVNSWGRYTSGSALIVGKNYCWDSRNNRQGYCRQIFRVSTRDDPNEEHYDFRGSYFQVMDATSKMEDEVRYRNNIIHADPPFVDVIVAHGFAWSREFSGWGYAYLHFILERTTRVPAADAFSWRCVKSDDSSRNEPEQFVGARLSTSRQRIVADMRCKSYSFGSNTKCYQYIWTAQTAVVDYRYNTTDVKGSPAVTDNTLDAIVLENRGSGVSGDDLARIGTKETISTQSSATFSSGFSVFVDLSIKIGFWIQFKGGVGAEFNFERDITKTDTVESSKEITWPSECPSGIRKTISLNERIEDLTIPVEFTLERAGSTWKENKDLLVTLTSTVIRTSECCLDGYEELYEDCNTEILPMC